MGMFYEQIIREKQSTTLRKRNLPMKDAGVEFSGASTSLITSP